MLDGTASYQLGSPTQENGRWRLFVVATRVLGTWLVIWVLAAVFLWHQYAISIRNSKQEGQHLSFVLAELAEQSLTVNQLVIDSMLDWVEDENVNSEADYRRVASSQEFFDRLKGRTQKLPTVDVATFIATDGTLLNYTRGYPPSRINLSDRDYFIEQMAANAPPVSLGKAVKNRGTGEWTFYLAKAVSGQSGSKLGVVIAGAGAPYFSDQFTRMLRHHENGGRGDDNAYLVRADGILLAATSAGQHALGMHVMPAQNGLSLAGQLDSFGKAAGLRLPVASVVSASRLTTFPAFLVTVTDEAAYLIEWWQTVWMVVGSGLVLSMLSLAVGWRNYRSLGERDRILRQKGERRVLSAIFGSPLALAALVTPDRRILYSNNAFSYFLSSIVRDQMLMPSPQVDGSDALIAFLADGPASADLTLRVSGTNCSRTHLRFSGARVDLGHNETAIALLGHDDTQRIEAEAHIIQSSKLITLGEMATGMAHELNQPLNVIKMAAQSALFEVEEYWALNPEQNAEPDAPISFVQFLESRLQRVVEQVDRAATIIDHMRIFGRVPSGKPPVIDVAATCRSALQLIGHQLRDAQVEVVLRAGEASPGVRFHPVLLEQVLVNLLLNARDAMTNVPAAKREVCIEVMTAKEEVMIMVSDKGPGIPAALRDRIFEPFFTTKSSEKGTGLGLSISYGIMRDSGGRLDLLDSSSGCSFCIVIPVATGPDVDAK